MTEKQDELADNSLDGAIGVILLLAGVALLVWGLLFDASVESVSSYGLDRIVNLGRLSTKLLIFCGGGFLSVAGLAWLAVNGVRKDIRKIAGRQ